MEDISGNVRPVEMVEMGTDIAIDHREIFNMTFEQFLTSV